MIVSSGEHIVGGESGAGSGGGGLDVRMESLVSDLSGEEQTLIKQKIGIGSGGIVMTYLPFTIDPTMTAYYQIIQNNSYLYGDMINIDLKLGAISNLPSQSGGIVFGSFSGITNPVTDRLLTYMEYYTSGYGDYENGTVHFQLGSINTNGSRWSITTTYSIHIQGSFLNKDFTNPN